MTSIQGKNLSYKYTNATELVLKNLNFTLQAGKVTTFFGASGSGKSTLLRCIAQLESGYAGELLCEGKSLCQLSEKDRVGTIGFVAQQYHLFPHLTVLQNCLQAQMKVLGRSQQKAQSEALYWLEQLGVADLVDRLPKEISGGQQQRVAIARALGMGSKVLLLDEPSAALDPTSTSQLRELLRKLANKGITIGLSTHNIGFASKVMDYAYLIEDGQIVESYDRTSGPIEHKSKMNQFLKCS